MKIITIGDIHGKDLWKRASQQSFDYFVFLGDYFDSFDIGHKKIYKNIKEIISFKREYPEKIILLYGNHDYHYLRGTTQQYSGYKGTHAFDYGYILNDARDEMQACFQIGEFFFSHAGITSTWLSRNNITFDASEINMLFKYTPNVFEFTPGINMDNYGNDITQGPLWVRPESLLIDMPDTYTQIVGHTQMNHIWNIKTKAHPVYFIDVLDTSKEMLIIEEGIPRAEII